MAKYVLKRLLQTFFTVLLVGAIVFLLMRMMPTDYFFTEDELMKLTEGKTRELVETAAAEIEAMKLEV